MDATVAAFVRVEMAEVLLLLAVPNCKPDSLLTGDKDVVGVESGLVFLARLSTVLKCY